MINETGNQEGRHIKVLTEIDISKPLVRGTKLQYKKSEAWIYFDMNICHFSATTVAILGTMKKVVLSERRICSSINSRLMNMEPGLEQPRDDSQGVGD